MPALKIMIINDSRAMRLFLEDVIKSYPDCEIIGSYFDARIAFDNLEFKNSDVILLDLEMPNLDGLTFLELLKNDKKTPTIIVSSYAKDNSDMISDAIHLGAIDSLAPPPSNSKKEFEKFTNILHHKIIKASVKSNWLYSSS